MGATSVLTAVKIYEGETEPQGHVILSRNRNQSEVVLSDYQDVTLSGSDNFILNKYMPGR